MKKRILVVVASCALLALASMFAPRPAQAAATTQSVAFPMYEYPTLGTLWDDIYAEGSTVPWIIINPAGGPGATVDPIYDAYLDNLPSSQRAIGYVNMAYNTIPMSQVLSDADDWYTMYPEVTGIFLDLLKNGGAPADVCYAATAYNYIRAKHPNDLIVVNPGSNIELAYEPYGDIFINTENTYAAYTSWAPLTDGFENNPSFANRFFHIVHTTSSGNLTAALNLTRANNAGWVLITDETMPNPYMAVPSYWSTFLSGVAALPQTQIPNRGLSGLPAGCLEMSLNMNRTTATQTKQVTNTITNTVTNLDTTRFNPGATKVSYTLPSGTSFASVSGSGWNCTNNGSTADCTNTSQVAANTALPMVSAAVAVSCNYTAGDVGVTLTTFAGDTVATQSALTKPTDCVDPVPTTTNGTGGAAAASKAKKVAVTEAAQNSAVTETPVVEENTVTTENSQSNNSYTPTPTTQDEPRAEQSTFEIMPIVFGGIIAVVLGLGVWWFVARRRSAGY